jgi:pimeloyl-ACP methyl ester carboxylesterase
MSDTAFDPHPATAFITAADTRAGLRQLQRDLGRIVSPHGVDEAGHVTLGGAPQWVAARGQDRRAPVLLFLHGGPNTPVSDVAYAWQRPWEDFFVVVNWDQRGCGRSAGPEDQADAMCATLTKAQWVADALELVEHLCQRFAQQKLIVVGQSWGTVLALELAHRRPERLHIVGLQGLAVQWLASAELLRQALIEAARTCGDSAEAERLEAVGPVPPPSDPDAVMAWVPRFGVGIPDAHSWHNISGPGDGWTRRMDLLRWISPDLPPEDYERDRRWMTERHDLLFARHVAGMKAAIPWDARRDVGTAFQVPVLVMQGTHAWQTHTRLARAYFDELHAPWKQWVEFPHAAHVVNLEQPGLSVVSLVTYALAAAQGRVPEGVERP